VQFLYSCSQLDLQDAKTGILLAAANEASVWGTAELYHERQIKHKKAKRRKGYRRLVIIVFPFCIVARVNPNKESAS
jgi:hypothetical protein